MSRIPTPAKGQRVVWYYWISRDSIDGKLGAKCTLWRVKPLRVKCRYRVVWVDSDHHKPGYIGEYDPQVITKWFGTLPETDLELIHVETYPTQKQLDEAK